MRVAPPEHSLPGLRPTGPWPDTDPPAGFECECCRVPPEAVSSAVQSLPAACYFSDGARQAAGTAAGPRSSRPAARTNPQAFLGDALLPERVLKFACTPRSL